MLHRLRYCIALLLTLLVGVAAPCRANAQINELPGELADIGIDEHPGAVLPKDVELIDQNGATVHFADYLDGKIPTIVVLAYYSCPMLCTLVLNGVTKAIKDVAYPLGQDYRVLVVSIDPRDTAELAQQKRANYVAAYGRDIMPGRSFDFVVAPKGKESEVKRLAAAIGFKYRWDEATKQYAHAAGAFLITPTGILSRTLYGIFFSARDIRLGLVEASQGKLGSSVDKLTLFCFHYDASKRGYVLHARRVMQLGGLLTMTILGVWLTRLWRRDLGTKPDADAPPAKYSEHPEHLV